MLVAVETKQTDTTTILYEFHRYDDGSHEVKTVKKFKPYFYVDEETPIENMEGVIRTIKGYTSIDNTPVKKVVMQQSKQVKPLRLKIEQLGYKHWEADILFNNRYTMDLPEDIPEGRLKVCWIDIETAPADAFDEGFDLEARPFPDVDKAEQVICCLTTKIWDERVTWLCGPKNIPGTRYFRYERDMLADFLDYYHKQMPDIISAWNLEGFDLPYIINRCAKLGLPYKALSKTNDYWCSEFKGRREHRLFGTIIFDLLPAYKLWRKYGNLPLLENHSLDFVAKTVVGEQKVDHGKSMSYLWVKDPQTLVDYNIQDVELLDKIDKQCKVVDFFDSLRRKCRIQFNDVYKTTALIDGYLLSRLKGSIILPTAKKNDEDKFGGAYVFDPIPGVYDYVLCEDIASMYPSIIKNYNISYETVGDFYKLPLDTGIGFREEQGIIPRFLDELKNERNVFKKLRKKAKSKEEHDLYDQRQYATKVVMNSLFGYLGFPGARLYRRDVAAAITGMGQYIIKKIAVWCEEIGNKVIYGDTDSVYVTATKTNPYEVVMEGVHVANHINKKLEEMNESLAGRNFLFIEFEKALKRVLFTDAKKRYAYTLLWEDEKKFNVDNKIKIQGFDAKRSDSNEVSKIVQKKVIEMIINHKTKREVVNYLRDINTQMKHGKFNDEQIGVPKGITKELSEYYPLTPIVKGAYLSNEMFNTRYGKGSKPRFVYIKNYMGKEVRLTIKSDGRPAKEYVIESIAFDKVIPEGFSVDWEKIGENTFYKKLNKIFEAAGWVWEDLDSTSLTDWC